ncbi:hypothetical protein BDY17DRAFT_101847 [Neohortaea acidophila]|uniref:Uncharacterized protein n=1 Tax=Neohortaea acidophila TaxID=245834 RepID=A0A6A6Q059_9PEZI|nr:uncharacterized protein BDY17DRAFT_101847 [Neohortaea acidophila]KAF2485376.1 hypothetical protein BDY17DRAFT_101847 [Neohortaea acidophila]
MQIDDTRDRVYISDLDAELADLEDAEAASAADERLIFLPDIEKHFSKIPQQVLAGGSDAEDGRHRELVLYDLPRSLTVQDEAQDSVRKAIIESRQRAREKAVEDSRQRDVERHYDSTHFHGAGVETAHGYSAGYADHSYPDGDPDAMDMDIG